MCIYIHILIHIYIYIIYVHIYIYICIYIYTYVYVCLSVCPSVCLYVWSPLNGPTFFQKSLVFAVRSAAFGALGKAANQDVIPKTIWKLQPLGPQGIKSAPKCQSPPPRMTPNEKERISFGFIQAPNSRLQGI